MAYNFGAVTNPNSSNVTITSGTIDGTTVGATVAAAGTFSSLDITGKLQYNTTTITANYTVASSDIVILVNNNPGAALTITLPSAPVTGRFVKIKDYYGNAATYNIIVAGNGKNIDGATSYTLSANFSSVGLVYTGTQWSLLDKTISSGTYDATGVAITGGSINNTTIGGTTPAAGSFTNLTYTGAVTAHLYVFTSGASYTCVATDNVIVVNKGTGSATTITLSSSPSTGKIITIKDGKGDAATNPITVTPAAGTIDGAANVTINSNYGSVDLIYNGTEWSII